MKAIRKRTLYKKLLTCFFLCICVVELTLGASYLYISGNIMKEQIDKSNSEYLRQILLHIESALNGIDNASVNFGAQGIVNATLRNASTPVSKFADYMEVMSLLYMMKETNPHIDSAYLHIRQDGKILTSDNAIHDAASEPELVLWDEEKDGNLLLHAPAGFRLYTNSDRRMLTMVRELPLVSGRRALGTLIIEISESSLNASINKDRVRASEEILLIGRDGRILSSSDSERPRGEEGWGVELAGRADANGAVVASVEGVRTMLTYQRSARFDWNIVSSLPYAELFREHNRMRTLMLSIGLAGLLVFLPIAGYLSKRLYHPISRLNDLLKQHRAGEQVRDEMQYINDSVTALLTDNASAYDLLSRLKPAARDKFVKDLLQGRQRDPDKVQEWLELVGLGMQEERFIVLVMEADRNRGDGAVPVRYSDAKELLERFLRDEGYACAIVETESGRLACLLNFPDDSQLDEDNIYFLLLDYKEHAVRALPFTVTIGIGAATGELMSVSASYGEAVRALEQKLAVGRNQVIRIHDIERSTIDTGYLDKDYIEYILKHMKSGRIDLCMDKTDEIMERMMADKLDSAVMLQFLHRLLNLIAYTLSEMGFSTEAAFGSGIDPVEEMRSHEDLSEMKLWFHALFERIGETMKRRDEKLPNELIMKVKAYARENYSANISISEMAEKVFLHPHYLGKMFKKEEGIAWNEYVNEIRMEKTRELLLETELKLSDISEAVGLGSAQYLIYCFKNRYGITPKKLRESHLFERMAVERADEPQSL